MQKILHPAKSRGNLDLGWLKANYSFSFAGYFNPERLQFGMLRVLNDDTIDPKMGFGKHPHENMEIITIPLKGSLKHRDSLGNEGIIEAGEVQVMSAGTGVEHSEFNASADEEINLLQIWIIPEEENVEPRYDQRKFDLPKNELVNLVSSKSNQKENSLYIHQQGYLDMGKFEKGQNFDYRLHSENQGLYVFVISGEISTGDENLMKRDAIGIWDTDKVKIEIREDAKILLIEVPMK